MAAKFSTSKKEALDALKPELERIVSILNRAISAMVPRARTFKLNQPASLTVCTPGGGGTKSYTKRGYIGGEEMFIADAYVGKSGKVICIFVLEYGARTVIEIPFAECGTKLDGFNTFCNRANEIADEAEMEEAKYEAEELEAQAYREGSKVRQIENPAFGTW